MSPDNRIYSNKEVQSRIGKEYGNRNLQDTLFYNNDAFYIKEYTLNGAKDLPGLTMPYEDLAKDCTGTQAEDHGHRRQA